MKVKGGRLKVEDLCPQGSPVGPWNGRKDGKGGNEKDEKGIQDEEESER